MSETIRFSVAVAVALAVSVPFSVFRTEAADAPKPKYGPDATPLSTSNEYLRKAAAPDFWALMPYYTAQQDGRSCSIASVTMVANGARAGQNLASEQELATQKNLLKTKTVNAAMKKGVGPSGRGVTLAQLGPALKDSLKGLGIADAEVLVYHAADTPEFRKQLHDALVENEKSAKDFIVINYLQGVATGDAMVGHIAPLGAFDSASGKALILDPDREWYEPYWVTEETLFKSMNTADKESGKNRGFAWVKLR